MIYLGIDPGASGGLTDLRDLQLMDFRNLQQTSAAVSVSMPKTDRDIWEWFAEYVEEVTDGTPVFAVIEKVSGYIGSGQPGSAMFKFGASYGKLLMALTASGIAFEEATPQRWQKALGIPPRTKKESKTQWKNRLKSHAQKLFPGSYITLATADSTLIAEYCRRLRTGMIK